MNYNEFKKYIKGERANNFTDKSLNMPIQNKLKTKERLAFWINDTSEQDEYNSSNRKMEFIITLYGVLEDGRSAVTKITDYKPFIDVLLTPKNHYPVEPSDRITPNLKEFVAEIGALFTEIKNDTNQFPKSNAEGMKAEIIKNANYAQDGYKPNDVHDTFIRLLFDRQKARKLMLAKLINEKYTTVNDDKSDLYCVMFRNIKNLIPASWVMLESYRTYRRDNIFIDGNECIYINHEKIKPVPEDYKLPSRPPATALAWDIETFHKDHELPLPDNGGFIFMIGVAIGWIHEKTSSYNLLITERPKGSELVPHFEKDGKSYKVVNCANENEVVKAFLLTLGEFKPQFTMQFNGWGYDDPFIKEYINSHRKKDLELKELIEKIHWSKPFPEDRQIFTTREIKITASHNQKATFIVIPGMCELDLMVVHMKLKLMDQMPKLNELLEQSKLAGKNDLPIPTMFEYYEEKTADKMAIISDYCMMDCVRTFELASKRKFIFDKIEEAVASYININQAILLANGRRVRNITCQWGFRRNIYFSNYMTYEDLEDDEKYEGAYVVPPIKGLKTSVLTPKERIKHARTSNYNTHSHWKDVENTDQIDKEIFYALLYLKHKTTGIDDEIKFKELIEKECEWLKKIKKYTDYTPITIDDHDIEFDINEDVYEEIEISDLALEVVIDIIKNNIYPIAGLDFASLYPSIIMGHNLSPEMRMTEKQYDSLTQKQKYELLNGVTKITIKNKGKEEVYYFKKHLDDESDHGIFPAILSGLFKVRKACKNKMLELQKILEKNTVEQTLTKDEVSDLDFEIGCLDSKQKALKVLMNTFYGESGNAKSTIYMLSIAAGITGKGRENLKYVKSVLAEKSIEPDYGDTDSLYIQQAKKHFFNVDMEYYGGKINKQRYWEKLFYISDKHLNNTKDDVNTKLKAFNRSPRLKMDYEEQLFPAIFYSKKIYEGVENTTIYNKSGKPHYFVRGLQKKRKNANKAVKYASNKVSVEAMSINNVLSLKEVTENSIKDICSKEWSLDDFKQSIMFRRGYKTDTCTVPQLIKRFAEEGKPMPKMGRRTFIVHVLKDEYDYKINGTCEKRGKAYYAELYEYAKQHDMKPWLMHYFESIAGQYGRFIASYYVDEAMVKKYGNIVDTNTLTDKEIDDIDKKAMAMGKKYCIEQFELELGIEKINHKPMKQLITKVGKRTNNFVLDNKIKQIQSRLDKIIDKKLSPERIIGRKLWFESIYGGQVYNNKQWNTHVRIKRKKQSEYKVQLNKLEKELDEKIKENIKIEEEIIKDIKTNRKTLLETENNDEIVDEIVSKYKLENIDDLVKKYEIRYYDFNYNEKYINRMDKLIRGN